jgi:P2-related tail formation protein
MEAAMIVIPLWIVFGVIEWLERQPATTPFDVGVVVHGVGAHGQVAEFVAALAEFVRDAAEKMRCVFFGC